MALRLQQASRGARLWRQRAEVCAPFFGALRCALLEAGGRLFPHAPHLALHATSVEVAALLKADVNNL
eukprot:581284-Prorocentrum_minimum.AAC.1